MTFAPNETPFVKLGRAADDEIGSISMHPDGSVLAACCEGTLQLVAWPNMKKGGKSKEHGRHAVFSPDGSLLAAAGATSVAVLDAKKATPLRVIHEGEYTVNQLAFSPDGKRIVVGEVEKALVIDVASGALVRKIPAFDRAVKRVAWSRDARWIATRSWEDAGVFDAKTGKRLGVLKGLDDEHADIVFTADGSVLTTIDEETVGVWRSGEWTKPARRIATQRRANCLAAGEGHVAIQDLSSIRIFDGALSEIGAVTTDAEPSSIAFGPNDSALLAGVGPTLFAWSSDAQRQPRVDPPKIDVALASTRNANRDIDVAKVSWLSRLGAPATRDPGVKFLRALEEWPGTDDTGVAAFLRFIQTLEEELGTAARLKGVVLPEHGKSAYSKVFRLAAKRVHYDEKADWATPANIAPLIVATLATIVERYRALDWPLPPVVETLWAWGLDGRLPCGFVGKPTKSPVKLLVT